MKKSERILPLLVLIALTIATLTLFLIPIINRTLNNGSIVIFAYFAFILFFIVIFGWHYNGVKWATGRAILFEDIAGKHEKFYKFSSTDGMKTQNLHIIRFDGGKPLLIQSDEEIPEGAFTVELEHTPDKWLFYKDVS